MMRKSSRKSLIPPVEVQDPVRNFSTRFSLKSYVKRVQQLTEEQRSVITKVGFGSVLLVPNHTLSKNLLAELMERWDCEKQAFVFHLGEISMTLLDVALILGLRVVGNPVVLKDDEPFSDLEEEYGATTLKRKVTIASLESRLDSLGDSVSDDFIRAFLLYTLGTLLFPNSIGKVDSRYLSFLRNLDDVCQFAWGAAVIEDLSQWLGKRKENNVQYVGGCLMFLQTWSYEHFDIGRPGLQDNNLTFPRLCRWDNSKSHQRNWFTSRFKDLHDDQVIWTLQPTSQELEIGIIKEAVQLQDDSRELQSAQSCSTTISTNVPDVDLVLKCSASKSNELHREQEVNFENQILEDTPPKMSTFDVVHREEVNAENLTVEDTPTKSSTRDAVYREEVNAENLIVEDTPTKSSTCDEVYREEVNAENLIVEGTPSKSSTCDEVHIEEVNVENLIVEDTPTKSSTCDEVHKEEANVENVMGIVEDTPTMSNTCDEVNREEVNAVNMIVEDTPTASSTCDEDHREEINVEKVTLEDTPTNSICDEVCNWQEVNLEKLIVEDTPTKLSICDDDLRRRLLVSEEENIELKEKISQLMEENRLLQRQVSINSQSEVQNADLKKELDIMREENQVLRLLINNYVTRMERHILYAETSETE